MKNYLKILGENFALKNDDYIVIAKAEVKIMTTVVIMTNVVIMANDLTSGFVT